VSALQLLFAQHELLQLAGGSLWKLRNEAPEARHFVGGQMATAERFQLRAIRLRTGLRLDEGRDNLTPDAELAGSIESSLCSWPACMPASTNRSTSGCL